MAVCCYYDEPNLRWLCRTWDGTTNLTAWLRDCKDNWPGGHYHIDTPGCDWIVCGYPGFDMPKGACCHQSGGGGDWACTVTTLPTCLSLQPGTPQYMGDYLACSQVQCEEPPELPERPHGCLRARTGMQFPRGERRWSIDLCGNAVYAPTLRSVEMAPEPVAGEAPYREGYTELLTSHLVRARAQRYPASPCRHHFGKVALAPDGYAHGIACSEPLDRSTRQYHYAPAFVLNEWRHKDFEPPLRLGYAGFVGAVHLPPWTELDYRAGQLRCGMVG